MSPRQQNKGRKFESKIHKTIGSGSLWFDKGDLKDENNTVECKYTDKKGFALTLKVLEKLWSQALTAQREPRLVIGIKRNDREMFVVACNVRLERNTI